MPTRATQAASGPSHDRTTPVLVSEDPAASRIASLPAANSAVRRGAHHGRPRPTSTKSCCWNSAYSTAASTNSAIPATRAGPDAPAPVTASTITDDPGRSR